MITRYEKQLNGKQSEELISGHMNFHILTLSLPKCTHVYAYRNGRSQTKFIKKSTLFSKIPKM